MNINKNLRNAIIVATASATIATGVVASPEANAQENTSISGVIPNIVIPNIDKNFILQSLPFLNFVPNIDGILSMAIAQINSFVGQTNASINNANIAINNANNAVNNAVNNVPRSSNFNPIVPPAPSGGLVSNSELETRHVEAFVNEINRYRMSHGLAPIQYDANLSRGAYNHSRWMLETGNLKHSSPLPYRVYGENIYKAVGSDMVNNPYASINSWKKSPAHNKIMLDPGAVRYGIGICIRGDVMYATFQIAA